jgi:hypothetical protein
VIAKRRVVFRYKGERNYIHGTDMFNEMLNISDTSEISDVNFSVHDFVDIAACDLYDTYDKKDLNILDGIKARCQFNINGKIKWTALIPDDSITKSSSRYEYDESRITSLCKLDGEVIELSRVSPFSFIESVVAMNKQLLESLFPDANGKWVFTRIDLEKFSTATTGLSLQFKHNMKFRLTKSDILVDGEKLGELYFSLVKS